MTSTNLDEDGIANLNSMIQANMESAGSTVLRTGTGNSGVTLALDGSGAPPLVRLGPLANQGTLPHEWVHFNSMRSLNWQYPDITRGREDELAAISWEYYYADVMKYSAYAVRGQNKWWELMG